jgi:formylglycine-generating enzyme required for sulfatase activity/outer membrane protein assembly factor BamB
MQLFSYFYIRISFWTVTILLFFTLALHAQVPTILMNGTSSNSAPVAPTAIGGNNDEPISFSANWDSVSGATGYRLDVALDNGFTAFVNGFNDKDVANVTSYPVTGLSANTIYHYRVRAYNTYGTSVSSNTMDVKTMMTTPTATAATDVLQTGFTANWNSVEGATTYHLDVATDAGFTTHVTGYNEKEVANVTTYSVTGLNAGTTYYFRVNANNTDGGASKYSNSINVTTLSTNGSPTITSFTPTSGPIGTTVTITGTNFSPTLTNNIVYFGAVRAAVTAASSTSLTVTVPSGASYAPITVTDITTELTAYSSKPFIVTFPSSQIINATSFASKVNFTTGGSPYNAAIGDIDGDGKPDLVVTNGSDNTVSVLRNTSASGSITASSFAPKVDFATGTTPWDVAIGDMDGDGKSDIIVTNNLSNTVSVLRNISSSGSITASSFAPKIDFTTGAGPSNVAIRDMDGDGKSDIIVTNNLSNTVSVLKNINASGSITESSFASNVDFITGTSPNSLTIGDVDGDGKPDLVVTIFSSNIISVLKNTSTSGSITESSFAPKIDFLTGLEPTSVAMGDMDGDSKPDLVVTNGTSNTVSVFRNTSTSGSITTSSFAAKVDFTIGLVSYRIAICDVDGDGKPDVVIANVSDSTVSVFRNTSVSGSINASSFASKVNFTSGAFTQSITIGDMDGDGKSDLVVSNINSNTISVLRNTISGSSSLQEMVQVSSGTFQMGSNDVKDYLASPPHSVTLGSYYIDKYEITYEKWTEVRNWALTHGYASADIAVGGNGYTPVGTNNPASDVNWYDILKWCNARSEKDGLIPVYYTDITLTTVYRIGQLDLNNDAAMWKANGYRLPTEAEWEFATRGGNQTHGYMYSGSNTIGDVAWYYSNSGYTTHQVGTKSANELGIYDMSGNVSEWCWDFCDYYDASSQTDPKGPNSRGGYRVVRGGSFLSAGPNDDNCRVAYRTSAVPPGLRYDNGGFRCASTIKAFPAIPHATIGISSSRLSFGSVSVGSSKNEYLKIYNYGTDSSLVISNITSSNPVFTVNRTSLTIAASECDSILVTFLPTIRGTIFSDSLILTNNDAEHPDIKVYLNGSSTDSLVAYYPFNGNANDESGNGHNATFINATLTANRFGKDFSAYSFNGTSNTIQCGDILDDVFCAPVAKFTITGWAKTRTCGNYTTGGGMIMSKSSGGNGIYQWNITHTENLVNVAVVSDGIAQNYLWLVSPMSTNQWFQFVLVFDGSLPEMERLKLYVNGKSSNTSVYKHLGTLGTTTQNSTQNVCIGASHEFGNPQDLHSFYNGCIDDIRIYAKALTQEEIDSLYHEGGWNTTTYSEPQTAFSINVGGPVYAGISILGDNAMYAIASGDAVYRMNTAGSVAYTLQVAGDIRSSSSIAYDTTVYIASSDRNLYAFSKDGNSVWSLPTGGVLTATPVVDSIANRLYIGVSNHNFIAVNRSTGKVDWNYFTDGEIRNSAVVTSDRKLIFATQKGTLYGLDLNNLTSPAAPTWQIALPDTAPSSIALDNQGYIYIGTSAGRLLKISMPANQQPSIVWQVQLGGAIIGSPVIDATGTLYVGSMDANLYAVDIQSGAVKWTFSTEGTIRSTPAISDAGNIYVANDNGEIISLDANKNILWYYKTSSAIAAPLLYYKLTLYIGTLGNQIIALHDGADSPQTLSLSKSDASRQITGKPVWATFQGNNQRTGMFSSSGTTGIKNSGGGLPIAYTLMQNYPNPFNPSTTIQFALPKDGKVSIKIFNMLGKHIATLIDGYQYAGYHEVTFNVGSFASGIYFYQMTAGSVVQTKKMFLMK